MAAAAGSLEVRGRVGLRDLSGGQVRINPLKDWAVHVSQSKACGRRMSASTRGSVGAIFSAGEDPREELVWRWQLKSSALDISEHVEGK